MTATLSGRSASGRRGNRLFEVLAVVLLGVATVGSAWCGYQASRWNGEENDFARDASDLGTEAARQFGLATQIVSYDSNMVAQYAEAVVEGNEALQAFYRESLMRPEFLPVLDRWEGEAQASGGSPGNLLEDEEYIEDQLVEYRATTDAADAASAEGDEAGANADDYVLTTLLLASALFFAGITTSFRVRFAQLLLLIGSSVTVAYAASRLADLPVA